jgi:hypothetical protein
MLSVQEYLLHGNTVESLEQFGIFAKYHPTKPYMILDYDQIESSKFKENSMVRECRGLVLKVNTWQIIHKSFNRFYNLNESSCTDKFDWTNFTSTLKEDGSLIKVRWCYGELLITTRNSFADSHCGESGKSWAELVESCLTHDQKVIIYDNDTKTFVFELLSPYNMVVVHHPKPRLVLLSVFDCYDGYEVDELNYPTINKWFEQKTTLNFTRYSEVMQYLVALEEAKDTTEGVVLKDCNGVRLKCKSLWYLKLHRLSGNGSIINTKNIVPIILQGEKDEILSYFPYLEDKIKETEALLSAMFCHLALVWEQCKNIEDQKEFALMITQQYHTDFSSILFNLKKKGKIQDFEALKHEWNQSEALILKVIKE